MNKKDEILIQDIKSWAWQLPPVIRRLFIKPYYNQGFVYIQDTLMGESPTYCSNRVRWLEKIKIETHSSKRANQLSWKFLREKHPQYTNFIQLF